MCFEKNGLVCGYGFHDQQFYTMNIPISRCIEAKKEVLGLIKIEKGLASLVSCTKG